MELSFTKLFSRLFAKKKMRILMVGKKACEDVTPIINCSRANCNLTSLWARRPRSASNTTPHPQRGSNDGGARSMSLAPAPALANHVQ
ncbi:hypothetical protein ACFX13_044394 [Malus domestica]